jgi:hypothetical protein
MDLPDEFFDDAIETLGAAMKAEDAAVQVRREGYDDRTGKPL